jgi:DNA-binding transcriptional regulator YdaS (Cro superfamily)
MHLACQVAHVLTIPTIIAYTFGTMTLADFMRLRALTDQAMADLIGVSRVTVTRYRNMVEQPSGKTIRKIVTATDGAVTANDLLGIRMTVE